MPSSTTALPSVPPRWTLLLDYTNGTGLNARGRFARDGESSSSQQVLLLEFRNHSTLPFTHISLIKAELTPEQKAMIAEFEQDDELLDQTGTNIVSIKEALDDLE